jgi:predicted kinase
MATRPKLIVLAGLPGSGKSTLARLLSQRLGASWLRVDTVEASLLKSGIPRSFETGLAAYLAARDIAEDNLRLGRDVVIDAVNGVEPARQMWRELAEKVAVARYVVEVRCSDREELRRRIEHRGSPTPPLPPLRWEEVVSREYVAWTEPILSVDSLDPPETNLHRVLDYCSGAAREEPSRSR